ncbi:LysM peptidoglycan-binding domain-containing protein [Thermopetrobacter sp. TC1]|uniref:LysM peptidoglycan-binding domain-containing protein n=1 Tax=Thermopetrobacter sp. TC1 TaxID=1495045 RepID=UPI000571CB8A|nr:LysM domain-containing protein [Thermopetrobacter sp. TC1]
MTKPLFPDRLQGRPAGTPAESAEAVLQRLRLRAGAEAVPPMQNRAPLSGQHNGATAHPGPGTRTAPAASATGSGHGHAPAHGGGEALADLPLDGLEDEGGWRAHFPILAAIFVVSAIAGGTLAGLLLAARPPATPQHAGVAAVRDTTSVAQKPRRNETILRPVRPAAGAKNTSESTKAAVIATAAVTMPSTVKAEANAEKPEKGKAMQKKPAPAAVSPVQAPSVVAAKSASDDKERIRKDEERIIPAAEAPATLAVIPASSAPAKGAGEMKEKAKEKSAPAKGTEQAAVDTRLALAAVVGEAMAGNPGKEAAAPQNESAEKAKGPERKAARAAAASPAEPPVSMGAASRKDMQALTENVVAALQNITRAGTAVTPRQTADLRSALAALVDRALAEGRSQEDVTRLLERALDETGQTAMPAALRGADGKVDLRLLLASIIPPDAAEAGNAGEQGYIEALKREGAHTSLAAGAAADSGRFYMRNGKRYTRVRRGDTLSRIAFEAYGDVLAYPLILRANADRIASVRNLKPGTELLIPEKSAAAAFTGPIQLAPLPATGKGKTVRKKTTAKKTRPAQRRKKARRARLRPRKTANAKKAPEQPTPTAQRSVKTNFFSRFTAPPQTASGASAQ